MIFKKALRQELGFTVGLVFMVLTILVTTTTMARFLANAASGLVSPKDVVVLICLNIIDNLAILLSVSIFVATLTVLIRWYKDSEMVIWQASGISLMSVLKAVLQITLPITAVVAVLCMVVSPMAIKQSNLIKHRFESREDVSMLAPGQFIESRTQNRVFFTEQIDPVKNTMANVFISDFGNNRHFIAVAKQGYVEIKPNGERSVILNNGRKYESDDTGAQFKITEFDRYTTQITPKQVSDIGPQQSTMQVWELLANWNKNTQAELMWRIGLPLMSLSFAALGVALAYTNPRNSRYHSLILAVLIYFTYTNLTKFLQGYVENGKLSFYQAWWPIHVIIFGIALILVLYHQNKSITFRKRLSEAFTRP